MDKLPRFEDLPLRKDDPPLSAWGLYGDHDQLGFLNRLTDATVLQASKEIQTGVRYAWTVAITLHYWHRHELHFVLVEIDLNLHPIHFHFSPPNYTHVAFAYFSALMDVKGPANNHATESH